MYFFLEVLATGARDRYLAPTRKTVVVVFGNDNDSQDLGGSHGIREAYACDGNGGVACARRMCPLRTCVNKGIESTVYKSLAHQCCQRNNIAQTTSTTTGGISKKRAGR